MSKATKYLTASVLVIAFTANPRTAQSQEAVPEPVSTPGLEEIVVTAEKRSKSIMTTAVSVTALDSDALHNLAPRNASDLAGAIPALQVNVPLGSDMPVFSLRGVSQIDYSPMQSGPIAAYVDEVYHGGPVFFSKQLFDIQRLEVLRGPQGTLYGKNATGGAVNFVTNSPTFNTEGNLTVAAGNYGRIETSGVFGTAVSDSVAIRLAFATAKADGWQHNIRSDGPDSGAEKNYGVRLSVLFRPSERFDATVRLATSGVGPDSVPVVARAYPIGIGGGIYDLFANRSAVTHLQGDYFPTFDWQHTAVTNGFRTDSADHDASLTVHWHLIPTLDLTSISAFSRGYFAWNEPNATNSPLLVVGDDIRVHGNQASQDLRISSNADGPTSYILGVYWGRDRLNSGTDWRYYADVDFDGDGRLTAADCLANLASSQLLYPDGCIQNNSYEQTRTSEALYADGTVRLTRLLNLRLGARYTRDTLDVDKYSAWVTGTDHTLLFNTVPGDPANVFAELPRTSQSFNKPTGRLGIDYIPSATTLLYATLSRGYRTGAVNASAYNSSSEISIVPPEVLDSAEAGWKGTYLDRRVQLMTAAYYYRYKGQQALNVDPTTLLQTAVSVPRSNIKGAEIEVTARPLASIVLRLGVAYLDSRIDEGTLNGEPLVGHSLPLAPRWGVNSSATWDVLQTAAGKLALFAAARYVTRQFSDLPNDPNAVINSYAVLDSRINYDFRNLPLSVSLYGKNLTDRLYFTQRYDVAAFGYVYNHVGSPRTFGGEIQYRF